MGHPLSALRARCRPVYDQPLLPGPSAYAAFGQGQQNRGWCARMCHQHIQEDDNEKSAQWINVILVLASFFTCCEYNMLSDVKGKIDGKEINFQYAEFALKTKALHYDPDQHYSFSKISDCRVHIFSVPNPNCDKCPTCAVDRPAFVYFISFSTGSPETAADSHLGCVPIYVSSNLNDELSAEINCSAGEIVITNIAADDYGEPTIIEGRVDISYGEHGSLSGPFIAKHCRNLDEGMSVP
jgi:hypothetical protein